MAIAPLSFLTASARTTGPSSEPRFSPPMSPRPSWVRFVRRAPLSLLLLLTDPALACGGFACDRTPVLQAAERVVFGVDEARGEVEMHVQVTYEGSAEDFGWIVPVPADPELFVTTSALFSQVALATQPTFTLRIEDGYCNPSVSSADSGSFTDATSTTADTGSYDVTVVSEQTVGPYETVILHASSADDLLGWLDQAGYQIPDSFEDVLGPYVADGASFVALKLAAGNDTGDLAPLGLRYVAERAAIPVRLTSISAVPDMRMEVYVFGASRGVPESYLHVSINDLALDWWTNGSNYAEVITEAANEAGGHAFATDYFGDSDVVRPFFDRDVPEGALRSAPGPFAWVDVLRASGVPASTELFEALEDALGLPDGTGASVWSCPGCTTTTTITAAFDADLATDIVLEQVFQPLLVAQALLDRFPRLARMTSSLDAAEMTVDPVFVMNPDLAGADVSNAWEAVMAYDCHGGIPFRAANRTLTLGRSGLQVRLPSEEALASQGMSEFEYIASLREQNAVLIEQLGASGRGEVVVDHRPGLAARVAAFNRLVAGGCGGGCSTSGTGAGLSIAAAAALWLRRRAVAGGGAPARRSRGARG
jgi:hypothetical protein